MSVKDFLKANGYSEVETKGNLFKKESLKRLGEHNHNSKAYYQNLGELSSVFEVRNLIRFNSELNTKLQQYDQDSMDDSYCEGCVL
jgi:hypothetical protein